MMDMEDGEEPTMPRHRISMSGSGRLKMFSEGMRHTAPFSKVMTRTGKEAGVKFTPVML